MKLIRPCTRFLAVLLLGLTLHLLTHGLVLRAMESGHSQNEVASAVSIMIDGLEEQAKEDQAHMGDFKPPKNSFTDYSLFFSPNYFIPLHTPMVSKLLIHEPFQAPPQIYLEITVPPDSFA